MGMRWHARVIVGSFAVLAVAPGAWATVDNVKTYKQAYPEKEKVSCKVCHIAAMGKATDLNGYGKALQQLPAPANPKKLTLEDYRAAEAADPDKDGATTLQELEAGTDPSDAASVPAGVSAPSAAAPTADSAAAESAPAGQEAPAIDAVQATPSDSAP